MRIIRANSLQEFKLDPTIDVLLMDGVATVGHDLSFVSDIICMEAIPQREAWDQLISRAYRMGADVRRPITVTTLAYKGSAEERLVPEHASQTVTSLGASLPVSACNVDGDQVNGHAMAADGKEDWEEDWEEDSAARQAAVVAVEDHPSHSKLPVPKRPKKAKSNTLHAPRRQQVGASDSAARAAASTPPPHPPMDVHNRTGICVLQTQTFLGPRTGHEFKLGRQGLGYYPTPERLRMLTDGLRERPQGRRATTTGT